MNATSIIAQILGNRGKLTFLIWWVMLTACAVCVNAGEDFDTYREVLSHGDSARFFERPFLILWNLSGHSYWIWRLMIWGGTTAFLLFTARLMNLPPAIISIAIIAFCIVPLSEWRQSLALSMFLCSIPLAFKILSNRETISKSHHILETLLVCSLIIGALCLHRASILLLLPFFISFLPMSRRWLAIVGCVFPSGILILFLICQNRIFSSGDSILISHLLSYFSSSNSLEISIRSILIMTLHRIPVILFFIFTLKRIWKAKKNLKDPFSAFSMILLICAITFITLPVDIHLYSRCVLMSLFPIAFDVTALSLAVNTSSQTFPLQIRNIYKFLPSQKPFLIIFILQILIFIFYTIPAYIL